MKNENLLLSADRKAKVEAKVKECLLIASEKYLQPFEMPEIRYDVKSTDGGLAHYSQWLIRLNLILMVENEEKFLSTTVPHEVAHLVAHKVFFKKLQAEKKRLRPHGLQWKEVMALFNVPAKVCHNYDCSSIQKPKRRARGSKLRGSEADLLIHRLLVAAKRLPKRHLAMLAVNISVLHNDLS